MRTYTIIPILVLACFFQACQNNSTAGEGALLSDGYISYLADGVPTIVHDSLGPGDPAWYYLYGSFHDSTLSFSATLSFSNGTHAQFTLVPLHDTGTYIFSNVSNGGAVRSSAEVYDFAKQADYTTDSLLNGEFHLTRFDTAHGRIAGTFEFTARRFNSSSESDTIRVENGVVFDFPISVIMN